MKKTTLILIIAIFMMFSKPVYALESIDSAEVMFKKIWQIINEKRVITPEIVDYSVEIIKKWPESIYAGECINAYRYSMIYLLAAPRISYEILEKNSRWFEKYIINNETAEIETAEIIVYATMLYDSERYTEYNTPIAFLKREDKTNIKIKNQNKKYIEYEIDFIKRKSIETLKHIENYSNNENYKVLAFFALLGHYCLTEEGISHAKQFIEKHGTHPVMAEARLYVSDILLAKNKFDEAIDEILKAAKTYNNVLVPLRKFNYGVKCYIKLARLYFEKKDYINAKKYILLLKEIAPDDYPSLKEMEEKLNIIEKLIKK